jgi:hypothetical protein
MGIGEWEHIRRAAYEGKMKEKDEKGQREIEEQQTALFLAFSLFFFFISTTLQVYVLGTFPRRYLLQ